MAADFPQLYLSQMGRIQKFVPVVQMLLAPEILDQGPNPCTTGMPADQPRADVIRNGEKVKFLTQLAMVPFPGLFKQAQMLF